MLKEARDHATETNVINVHDTQARRGQGGAQHKAANAPKAIDWVTQGEREWQCVT